MIYNKKMVNKLYILLFFSIFITFDCFAELDLNIEDNSIPTIFLNDTSTVSLLEEIFQTDNVWTGNNTFYNLTIINFTGINVVNNSNYLGGYPASYFYPYSNPFNFINASTLIEQDPYYFSNPYNYTNQTSGNYFCENTTTIVIGAYDGC